MGIALGRRWVTLRLRAPKPPTRLHVHVEPHDDALTQTLHMLKSSSKRESASPASNDNVSKQTKHAHVTKGGGREGASPLGLLPNQNELRGLHLPLSSAKIPQDTHSKLGRWYLFPIRYCTQPVPRVNHGHQGLIDRRRTPHLYIVYLKVS